MRAYGVTLRDWEYGDVGPLRGAKASRSRANKMGTTIEESLEETIQEEKHYCLGGGSHTDCNCSCSACSSYKANKIQKKLNEQLSAKIAELRKNEIY